MPKAIVSVKNIGLTTGNVAIITYDLLIDTGGYQLSGLELTTSIGGSPTLINNALRSRAIIEAAEKADGTVIANNDIVIFCGAQ